MQEDNFYGGGTGKKQDEDVSQQKERGVEPMSDATNVHFPLKWSILSPIYVA